MVRMKLGLSASEVQEMSMQYALPGGFLVSLDNGAHLRNLSSGFAVQELLTHRDLLTEDDWQPFMHSLRQHGEASIHISLGDDLRWDPDEEEGIPTNAMMPTSHSLHSFNQFPPHPQSLQRSTSFCGPCTDLLRSIIMPQQRPALPFTAHPPQPLAQMLMLSRTSPFPISGQRWSTAAGSSAGSTSGVGTDGGRRRKRRNGKHSDIPDASSQVVERAIADTHANTPRVPAAVPAALPSLSTTHPHVAPFSQEVASEHASDSPSSPGKRGRRRRAQKQLAAAASETASDNLDSQDATPSASVSVDAPAPVKAGQKRKAAELSEAREEEEEERSPSAISPPLPGQAGASKPIATDSTPKGRKRRRIQDSEEMEETAQAQARKLPDSQMDMAAEADEEMADQQVAVGQPDLAERVTETQEEQAEEEEDTPMETRSEAELARPAEVADDRAVTGQAEAETGEPQDAHVGSTETQEAAVNVVQEPEQEAAAEPEKEKAAEPQQWDDVPSGSQKAQAKGKGRAVTCGICGADEAHDVGDCPLVAKGEEAVSERFQELKALGRRKVAPQRQAQKDLEAWLEALKGEYSLSPDRLASFNPTPHLSRE